MMNLKRKGWKLLMIGLLVIFLPLLGLAENADAQEIQISNMPVKGQILLDKTGMKQTGTTYLGEAVYETGYLKGAVFEIRAA